MSKKRILYPVIGAVVLGGAVGGFCIKWNSGSTGSEAAAQNIRTETVKSGSVRSGITEDGTVRYGSSSQVFSVAEITDTGSSGSTSSAENSSSSVFAMGGGAAGNMGAMPMNQGGSSGQTSANTASSGTTTELEVEKVYVSAGQVVKVGDPILKITEESIEAYRTELENAAASAALTVQKETINAETKKAEAEYTYHMYLAEGETAQATYDATITSLENAVTDLEEDLEEAQEELVELQEESEAGSDVSEDLEEAQLNVETLEANLQVAKNNLTTQSIEAKQMYENAMTNYKYADQLYAIDTDGVEDDLNEAKEAQSEADQALSDFNEQIKDGIVYAEYAGSVTSVAYAAGDTITNEAEIVVCNNPEEVTMTVSVTQDDISNISVGDNAVITLTAYGNEEFAGEVQSIESASSMGGTVVYSVEVRFTGDTQKVYSGMTGEVTFIQKSAENVLNISNKAVLTSGTRSYVKVQKDDGTIQEIDVKTGFSNGSRVEITEGLNEGETVVLESQVAG